MRTPLNPHQHTIKNQASCCGAGLHSGRTVNLTIKPAPVDNGYRFFRTDLETPSFIQAHMDKVVDTKLATTIGNDNFRISTIEHLLAALRSSGIDNVDIELDSPEVPIMDGSAEPFLKLIDSAGMQKQRGLRKVLKIIKPIYFEEGDCAIQVTPYHGFKITGEIDFNDQVIQQQHYSLDLNKERFCKEIAKARTFGYVEQVEELWANGLALGGTLENVIAIHWNRSSILNEDGLRYEDEFIRHKVLDLVGDITLLGCPLLGHVTARKAGHRQHLSFMEKIALSPHSWELVELGKNGTQSVISNFVSNTKVAEDVIMPFLKPLEPAIASL